VFLPGVADAQVSVAQDSCFNMGGFVRVYFTVTNNSGGAYSVQSFTMRPNPPSASCDIFNASAAAPWVHTLAGAGSVQFLAPPTEPAYFLGSRGEFTIDVTSADCCYEVNYYDQTISLVYTDQVCFSSPCFNRPPILDDPVQWPGNGLYYEFVSAPGISWSDATTAASQLFWQGTPGSLVYVLSQAEQDWIVATLAPVDAWTSGVNAGQWFWHTTGNPINFFDWCPGEPNEAPFAAILMTTAG